MLTLMVIDEHKDDREVLEHIVKSLSDVAWMGSFSRPQDALREVVRDAPDVVIAAVELTEMNGLAFTSKLQGIRPSVHVIVSAQSGDYARQAYEAGARGYLIKPVSKESVKKVLDQARENLEMNNH